MGNYIQKIVSSRMGGNANIFIGELGRMFYDQDDGIIRLSDGKTAGGIIVSNGSGGNSGPSSGIMVFDSGGATPIDVSNQEFILNMGDAS